MFMVKRDCEVEMIKMKKSFTFLNISLLELLHYLIGKVYLEFKMELGRLMLTNI